MRRVATTDAERPLTPKGKRQLRRSAKAMQALELSFDAILSSPYTRARDTARIVARQLRCLEVLEFADPLKQGGSLRAVMELVKRDVRHPRRSPAGGP